jgi:hypothetical protein
MTKTEKEKLSNRLVLNFAVLLGAALILLYVYNGVISAYVNVWTNVLWAFLGIGVVGAAFFFVWGKLKKPNLFNYGWIFAGIAIASALVVWTFTEVRVWVANFIPFFQTNATQKMICAVYILMLVYFIALYIVTTLQQRRKTADVVKMSKKAKAKAVRKAARKKEQAN